ncbi:MAG TPA: hypothetical protein DCS93_01105 [Microscillaceae bacterium]|nr:hypothetical protein [Microscillaceae bacterium]
MNPKLTIALITLLACWGMNSKAQYVPKTQRKSISQFHTIKIKKGEQITVKRPRLFCDTLIMEDESTLKVPHIFKSFTLYAKYCKIGNGCVISSRGKNGKVGVVGRYDDYQEAPWRGKIAEAGSDAPRLNLYLNIYALGNLTIDATGGHGANAQAPLGHFHSPNNISSQDAQSNQIWTQIPGVYGSGGDVNLQYYAPFIVSIKKANLRSQKKRKRKISRKKNQIRIGNTIGEMDFRIFRVKSFAVYQDALGRQRRTPSVPKRFLQLERNKRNNGTLKFNRRDSVLLPEDVKMVR